MQGGPDSEAEGEEAGQAGGILGLSVRNLTRDQADDISSELHLGGSQGVLVSDVRPGGFAADLGVLRGDVILQLNHQPVRAVEEFSRLQGQLKSGSDVLFLIARRTQRTFTTLYLADHLP
jgi:serine protease Do